MAIQQSQEKADRSLTATNADTEMWEHHIESDVDRDASIPPTERKALITARRGQGLFKERVMQIEKCCRSSRVDNPVHLRASHYKPWRDSNNQERLDGENGMLLTPSMDHLFDRGFISFEDDGGLIISPVAHRPSLERMGVPPSPGFNVGHFSSGQCRFLEYHRDAVLLSAALPRRAGEAKAALFRFYRIYPSGTASFTAYVKQARIRAQRCCESSCAPALPDSRFRQLHSGSGLRTMHLPDSSLLHKRINAASFLCYE